MPNSYTWPSFLWVTYIFLINLLKMFIYVDTSPCYVCYKYFLSVCCLSFNFVSFSCRSLNFWCRKASFSLYLLLLLCNLFKKAFPTQGHKNTLDFLLITSQFCFSLMFHMWVFNLSEILYCMWYDVGI